MRIQTVAPAVVRQTLGRVVVALGGHALESIDPDRCDDAVGALRLATHQIAAIVADGAQVVVTHGNGPQVGAILEAFEATNGQSRAPAVDTCVAFTQGALGYAIQTSLEEQLRLARIQRDVAALITRVRVDSFDSAWQNPSKPIGRFLSLDEARVRQGRDQACALVEDQRWRRVIASPEPLAILDVGAIRNLLAAQAVVIAGGGGGIPVVAGDAGVRGVDAVIDKDLTSTLLATSLDADTLVIATDVDHAYMRYGEPDASPLEAVTSTELHDLLARGEFGKGSMEPKVKAAIRFVEHGGRRAVICSVGNIHAAARGRDGTIVTLG